MKNLIKVVAAVLASASLINCTGGTSADGGSTANTTLSISGKLGTVSASAMKMANGQNTAMAVTLTDLEIYAIAFTSPPVIAEADVNSDGSFTVNLPGAKGSSVTAVFRDKTSNNEVGTIVFKDNSQKDMAGNAKESSSIVFSDNVTLGDITLSDDGKVTVDVATIVASNPTAIVAPPSAAGVFDMSGVWKASAYSPLPTGYRTTCPADMSVDDCGGIPEGGEIALARYAGKLFTPNSGTCDIDGDPVSCATTDGEVSSTDRYALSVWDKAGFASCGYKTGFTEAEARAGGFIHLTTLPVVGQQVTFGSMNGYNQFFWLKAASKATWPIMDCHGVNVTVGSGQVKGYACRANILNNGSNTDTNNDGWQVSLGNGGCLDSNSKPIMVNNWAGLTSTNCTDSSNGLPAGFYSNSCSYSGDPDGTGPASSTTFTCSWAGGQFADNSGEPNYSSPIDHTSHYLSEPIALVNTNGSCGVATDGVATGLTLSQMQCAANYYFNNQNTISTGCGPKPRFNWSAQTVEDFYRVDYREKPDAMFLMDILSYDSTGTVGTLDTEERESFTVKSGEDSSVTCEVARKIVFNVRKTSDTTSVIEIRFSGRMASTAAVCQGLAKQALENVEYNKTVTDDNLKRRAVDNADLEHVLAPEALIFNMTKQ